MNVITHKYKCCLSEHGTHSWKAEVSERLTKLKGGSCFSIPLERCKIVKVLSTTAGIVLCVLPHLPEVAGGRVHVLSS